MSIIDADDLIAELRKEKAKLARECYQLRREIQLKRISTILEDIQSLLQHSKRFMMRYSCIGSTGNKGKSS